MLGADLPQTGVMTPIYPHGPGSQAQKPCPTAETQLQAGSGSPGGSTENALLAFLVSGDATSLGLWPLFCFQGQQPSTCQPLSDTDPWASIL